MSKCHAVQHSDQMVCKVCQQKWDTNDASPPACDAAAIAQQEDNVDWDDYPLPHWAERRITKDDPNDGYMVVGAQLCTRDDDRHGNAVVYRAAHGSLVATCITDVGTEMRLNLAELREGFHPPMYVMKYKSWAERTRIGISHAAAARSIKSISIGASCDEITNLMESLTNSKPLILDLIAGDKPAEKCQPITIDDLDEDDPIWRIAHQIDGLMDGIGAPEDHDDVKQFLLNTGLPKVIVEKMHRAILFCEAYQQAMLGLQGYTAIPADYKGPIYLESQLRFILSRHIPTRVYLSLVNLRKEMKTIGRTDLSVRIKELLNSCYSVHGTGS